MERREPDLDAFGDYIDAIITSLLTEVNIMVGQIGQGTSEEELVNKLKEANSLIRLVCGGDTDLYKRWQYRLIRADREKYIIVQGEIIDVENNTGIDICEE